MSLMSKKLAGLRVALVDFYTYGLGVCVGALLLRASRSRMATAAITPFFQRTAPRCLFVRLLLLSTRESALAVAVHCTCGLCELQSYVIVHEIVFPAWNVLYVLSFLFRTVPQSEEDQDEVSEKMQLNLAKRLLMCPYFNQRLKGISDIKDMVCSLLEALFASFMRSHIVKETRGECHSPLCVFDLHCAYA